jgi:hypothetical protein
VEPVNNNPKPSVRDQLDALELFSWLALEHPSLPAPYLTVHTYLWTTVGVQVPHAAFEAWREALGLNIDDVKLRSSDDDSWLLVDGEHRRTVGGKPMTVRVQLNGVGLPLLAKRPAAEAVAA